ncbi:MAG: glutamate 5-kinase [Patescibacteria group bacterium]
MTVVFKIGTNVLLGNKDALDLDLMQNLVKEISKLYEQDYKIVIITSGAVAVGQAVLSKTKISRSTAAAIGQPMLMRYYTEFFSKNNIKIAQILLSPNSFKNRERYEHLKKTLQELLDNNIIAVINENDPTVLKDTFGDNDSLAAMIAVISNAQKLVFLTDLDGLYSADPKIDKSAKIIKEVKSVDLEIQKMCSQKTSSLGRGGMLSKLKGAKLATTCGIEVYIINGSKPDNISRLLIESQTIGTRFLSQKSELSERKKWLLIGTISQGKIIVDQGARAALENKNSLLAVGVRKIKGNFDKGDFVNIADSENEIFAFGIVNYNSKELMELVGLRDKKAIRKAFSKEVVHIDNLTLLK